MRASPLALPLLLIAAASATGCRCGEETPYAPFEVSSTRAVPTFPERTQEAGARNAGRPFEPRKALLAPPHATTWPLEGRALKAPKGFEFSQGLIGDFGRDGIPDAVVWVTAANDDEGPRGALYVYPGVGPGQPERIPRQVAAVPAFVPTGPECDLQTELTQTGNNTITVDTQARCKSPLIPRAPVRSLRVFNPTDDRPEVLNVRLAAAAAGEEMTVSVNSTDQDGDGRDDARLLVSMKARGTQREAVGTVSWIDRAAGLARDPTEPVKSFEAIGSVEVVRARGKNTSRTVRERVDNARRLFASLCAESGTARVFDGDGAPMACGNLTQAFQWYATAELRAALTEGRWIDAFGALTRDGWYYGALRDATRAQLEKELRASVKSRKVELRQPRPRPLGAGSMPRFSPLTFTDAGALLVQTRDGIFRIDLESLQAEAVDDEVDPWPLTAIDADGNRWTGVALPCDQPNVSLLLTSEEGAPLASRPIDLLAPRPGACRPGHGVTVRSARPVAWSGTDSVGIFAGHVFGRLPIAGAPAPGSPRSADGKLWITATPLGLLVTGNREPALWENAKLTLPDLEGCVISNGARAAACVRKGRVVLIQPSQVE